MKNLFTFCLAICFSTLYAQTGPGGVGNSTNNVIWLDAADIGLNDNDPVSSWVDKSGNGNNLTQGVANRMPAYVSTAVSGKPAVYFNSRFLEISSITALNSSNFTQFILTRADNNTHIGFPLSNGYNSGAGTNSEVFWGLFMSTIGNQFRSFTRDNSGLQLSNELGFISGYQIISSIISSSTNAISGYYQNSLIGSQGGYNTTPTTHLRTRIGSSSKPNAGDYYRGHIAEVIVYNEALNSAQHNIVNNYLGAKYRRTITNDYFAHELTHRGEVFGIGQEADGGNFTAQGTGIVEFSNPTLSNSDYIIAGHNELPTTSTTNDIPPALAGAARLQRIWRVTSTGTPGTLDITFDVSTTVFNSDTEFTLVVESNDGVFANGGTTEYGPITKVGNLVSFTGVSLPDNAYFTLFGPSPGIRSIATGNWHTASTWDCNCIPGQIDKVTIKSPHNVTINLNSSVTDLTVEAGATLTSGSSRVLSVYGNLSNSGTFVSSTGNVTFAGTGTQTFTNNSATPFTMYNFYITGGSTVELYNGDFEVRHGLRVTSGHLNNVSGSITLLSNSTSTAFIHQSVSNAFSGEFIIQRFISQRNASWGDLASPVINSTLKDWDSNPTVTAPELFMCGVAGISGNCGGWKSVYQWEPNFQDYVAVTDTSFALTPGSSLEIWLEDTNSLLFDKTFDTRGTPNSGNVVVPIINSWNLVGNPYAAWVTWASLTKPTLYGTYYIWNTNTGSYDAKTNGSIPPHQGFWVESVGSGNLTFKETAKYLTNSSTFFKTMDEAENELIDFIESTLKISNPKLNYSHELKLRLNELAKVELDEFDASFLPSKIKEAPSISAYSISAKKHLAINSFNNEREVVIPITIKSGVDANHLINTSIKPFEEHYQFITLYDSQTKKYYNLKEVNEIEVFLSSDEDDVRFELRLSNSLNPTSNSLAVNVYKNAENTVIEFGSAEQLHSVSIVNVLGQKVIADFNNINGNQLIIPNTQLPKGINIISIKSIDQTFIKKLNY